MSSAKNTILYYTIIISSLKKKIKQYQKIIFSFVILLFVFSCKKINILAPETIPKETKFEVLSPTPTKVDVNPQPAQNGEVFGGFTKKFFYQGEWYILANYIYNYDPTNQTLRNIGSKALLKLDKDGKLLVLGRDLGNVKDGNGITTWTHLTECDIIEENQVWYQDRNIDKYGFNTEYISYKLNGFNVFGYKQIAVLSNNLSYHAYGKDLLNWNTKGSDRNIAMSFPNNWGAWFGKLSYYYPHQNVYFKGKLYVLGGGEGANGRFNAGNVGDRVDRNFKNIKVIDWGKDGNNVNNWITHSYPSGVNTSYIQAYISKYGGEEKLYIHVLGNYYWVFDREEDNKRWFVADLERYSHNPIYSTTGAYEYTYEEVTNAVKTNYIYGIPVISNFTITNIKIGYKLDWQKENSLPPYRTIINEYYRLNTVATDTLGPKIDFLPTTPKPVNYVFDTNENLYYKVGDISYYSVSYGGKTYYLPIPPANEIYEAAYSGKTNFTITDKHIKNAGKNQFMFSKVNPTNARDDDWKLIAPYEYTGYSMVWNMGSQNYLFNVKNEIYQLMDYSYLDYFDYTSYTAVINELRRLGKIEREKNSAWYYYRAMYYEAQADILEAISKKGGYIKPEHAVTHYKIDFMHH